MKVTIIAVGTKMDRWIKDGCQNYINRLPKKWELKIIEIVQKNYQNNQSKNQSKSATHQSNRHRHRHGHRHRHRHPMGP